MDFRSDKLWELYVEWEREQGDLRAVTAIYDRVLSMPTQLYNQHWEKYVVPSGTGEGGKEPPSVGKNIPPGKITSGGVINIAGAKHPRGKRPPGGEYRHGK